MRVLDILSELEDAEVSVTLLKSHSALDALSAILKILEQAKETLVVESVFDKIVGGLIGQLDIF